MGFGIGQTTGPVSVLPVFRAGRSVTDEFGLTGQVRSPEDEGSVADLFNRERPQTFRVGFGDGTVSAPAAAVSALGRGLSGARRIVPSAEEVWQRQHERRDANARATQQTEYRRLERRRLDVMAQSRSFINRLNEVAGMTEARLRGEESPPAEDGATLEMDGETFAFRGPANGFNLDVFA